MKVVVGDDFGAWLLLSVWNERDFYVKYFRRLVAASLEGLVTMGVIECRSLITFYLCIFQTNFYFRHDQELCAEFSHTDGELAIFSLKLIEFIDMCFCLRIVQGEEEQDTLVYLPEGLTKGGKKIHLSASFFDHKDISAGDDESDPNNDSLILRGAQPSTGADKT